jgi:NTP pyrophosphatase (non-canonical NTP hydrolase)
MRDGPLTFREFSDLNRKRCESEQGFHHALEEWSLSDWLTAVAGELGEAANVIKKLNRVRDGIPGNSEAPAELRKALREEIADTFIYLDLLAQRCGFSLEAVVRDKWNAKSRELGFPFEC